MAQSKDNIIADDLSCKLSNILILSQRHGKIIVSKVPVPKRIEFATIN